MYLDLSVASDASPIAGRIAQMEAAGVRVVGILRLLAFRPEWSEHLNRFTQEVMRGPGDLPVWQRELIAGLTSCFRHCQF